MNLTHYINTKLENLALRWARTSPQRYLNFLRRKGVSIGQDIFITKDVKSLSIDTTRPSLITIGNKVRLNKNLTLVTHDGAFYVLKNLYKEFVSQSGRITIGNNVYFGRNCTVLMNVTIGDNCIIGFGSVVTRDIPPNSVAVGAPAKVICTIEDYYKNRKKRSVVQALDYARSIQERYNRRPVIEDFWEEFPLFLKGSDHCSELPIQRQMGDAYTHYTLHNEPVFDGFEDFLKQAGIK